MSKSLPLVLLLSAGLPACTDRGLFLGESTHDDRRDLSIPRDLSVPHDLSAAPDLRLSLDLSAAPDLEKPIDLALPSDAGADPLGCYPPEFYAASLYSGTGCDGVEYAAVYEQGPGWSTWDGAGLICRTDVFVEASSWRDVNAFCHVNVIAAFTGHRVYRDTSCGDCGKCKTCQGGQCVDLPSAHGRTCGTETCTGNTHNTYTCAVGGDCLMSAETCSTGCDAIAGTCVGVTS